MDSMSLSFDIKTFGCKVNTYDASLLHKRLQAAGFFRQHAEPMVHVVNTCAVTQEATREAMRYVRRLRAKNPLCTIVMTGCSAQVDGKLLDEMPGVDLVVANSHKGDLENILVNHFKGNSTQKVFRSNIFRNESLGEGGDLEDGRTRSFLKIQDGCNSFCTFCIIPYARGKSRSLSVAYLSEKIQSLVFDGIQEVVLTGVHIGDYLDDSTGKALKLEDLLETLLEKTNIPRLRLSSMEPIEINARLLALYKSDRMCPHFHMSIQSAQTEILKGMRRNYTSSDIEWALNTIQAEVPGAFVGMDVIVGFPGETEKHFEETFSRLEKLPWTRIHVFPYSERQGTRAPLMEGRVSTEERKRRSKVLRQLSLERYTQQALDQVGSTKRVVLLNSKNSDYATSVSRDYWNIDVANVASLTSAGRELTVRITGYDHSRDLENNLIGEVIHELH
jgi:threonylcarbamoyladenosine tRNA methylthiotransferase MtaB